MSPKPSEFEHRAQRELPKIFGELASAPAEAVHVSRTSRTADFIIDLPGRRLVAEAKASARTGEVAQAARRAKEAAAELGGLPVVVVPHMGAAGRRVAEQEGVGYVDLSGNAHLRDHDWYVHVEGRPNRFPTPGRPSSPFAPVGARVARALLNEPERWWRQVELVDATGLDDGRVSHLVRRLSELELVELDHGKLRPLDPAVLLDALAEAYEFRKHEIVAGHVSGAGISLARHLGEALRGNKHAFTGLPAAWLLDGFAQFRRVSVYVDGDPHQLADDVGLRQEPRGANAELIGPNDPGVFYGSRDVDGLTCAAPVQVYLDLLALPERAQEAADHLRDEVLGLSRNG